MPDGPFMTPDEEAVMRMIHVTGTPQGAAADLLARLEALEAAAEALEAQMSTEEGNPREDEEAQDSDCGEQAS